MIFYARWLRVLAGGALLVMAAGAHAADVRELGLLPAPATDQAASATAEVAALQSAYSTLASANHNYGNHRVAAMQAIAQACTLLGATATGGGGGGEWQVVSDIQMHQAQATLQLVRAGLAKGQQPRVAALLDTAISQIGLALAVN